MADKLMRVQVIIPLDGAVPEDYCVNTWHFDGDDNVQGTTTQQYVDAVDSLLTAFYGAIAPSVFPTQVSDPATAKVYDMRDPEPRVPIGEFTIPYATSGATMLPGEVAICVSMRANYESGVPNARRRGRIFLGPIASTAGVVVNSQLRPSAAVRTTIANAMATMIDGVDAQPGEAVKPAIYSPTTDLTQSLDDAFNDVVGGWIDDAFDTQRRRGCAPTARTLFS